MALQREQSRHNPRKAALRHDGREGVFEVKCAPRMPPERFQVYKDGSPVTDVEFRRVEPDSVDTA